MNSGTHVASLTTAQVLGILSGKYTNWAQLGGPSGLPIRIVSRYPDSGSRRTFDQFVLGGAAEPQPSSYNCLDKNEVPSARVTLCQEPSTQALLQAVAATPGAIGYGEENDVASSGRGLNTVELNTLQPTFGNIGTGANQYPFWTVEYLYTYGSPATDSLAGKFLGYVNSSLGKVALKASGVTPCVDGSQNLMTNLCAYSAR